MQGIERKLRRDALYRRRSSQEEIVNRIEVLKIKEETMRVSLKLWSLEKKKD